MSLTSDVRPYRGNTWERTPGRKNTMREVFQMQVKCFYVRVKMKISRGPRPHVRTCVQEQVCLSGPQRKGSGKGSTPRWCGHDGKDPSRPGLWDRLRELLRVISCLLQCKQFVLQAMLLLYNNPAFLYLFHIEGLRLQESSHSPGNTTSPGRAGRGGLGDKYELSRSENT